MRSHSWEQSVVLTAGLAVLLWIGGIVLYIGGSHQPERLGLLLTVAAATATVLAVLRSWQMRMRRAFVHGYHAGFHDGARSIRPTDAKDCDVLEFSEVQARRLSRLG